MTGAADGRLGAAATRLFGIPPTGSVPAELTIEATADGDRWTRRFGRRRWTTTCERTGAGLVEWLGPTLVQRHRLIGIAFVVTSEDGTSGGGGVATAPGGGPTGHVAPAGDAPGRSDGAHLTEGVATAAMGGLVIRGRRLGAVPGVGVSARIERSAGTTTFDVAVRVVGHCLVGYRGWLR